jgi:hypothetical protein
MERGLFGHRRKAGRDENLELEDLSTGFPGINVRNRRQGEMRVRCDDASIALVFYGKMRFVNLRL